MPPPLSSPVGAEAPRAPPSRRSVAVISHAEYVPTPTAATALHAKVALSKAAWWPWHFDLLKVVSESRVTWATFVPILVPPRPLCSRITPDVPDFFWSQTGLVLRPTVSDHITGNNPSPPARGSTRATWSPPAGFGTEPRPTEGLPLFSALRIFNVSEMTYIYCVQWNVKL